MLVLIGFAIPSVPFVEVGTCDDVSPFGSLYEMSDRVVSD
jgi:hypothetical protein